MARILIWHAVRAGIDAQVVLFDNWYASRDNLRFFKKLGLSWATRLKKNTKVLYQGQRLTVAQLAASVPKANYHYYAQLGARARSFVVTAFGVEIKLTAIKDDSHVERDRVKFLATNLISLTCLEHIEWYRRRWSIECFFRDAKQLLGLSGCQARAVNPILTHIILVCVAYVLLQLLKPVGPRPMVSVVRSQHALVALRLLVRIDGTLELMRLAPSGRFDPADLDHLFIPVRTRLSGDCLPKTLKFP